MKRIMTILLTASLLLAGTVVSSQAVKAEENSASIYVSYEPGTKADFHTLTLSVSGGGRVLDGTQIIRQGIITYDLPEGAQKTFRVEPYKGYRLQSARYEADGNSQDLKDEMQGKSLSIQMGKTNSSLAIVFEKISGQQENSDEKPADTVKTGDASNIQIYFGLMLAALVTCEGICRIKRNRRKKN